jgi:hypothetical protein
MLLFLLWVTETIGWYDVLQYQSVYTTFRRDWFKVASRADGLTDMITCLKLDMVIWYVDVTRYEEIGARVRSPIVRRTRLICRHLDCICKYCWQYKQSSLSKALLEKLQLLRYKRNTIHLIQIEGQVLSFCNTKTKGTICDKQAHFSKPLSDSTSRELD